MGTTMDEILKTSDEVFDEMKLYQVTKDPTIGYWGLYSQVGIHTFADSIQIAKLRKLLYQLGIDMNPATATGDALSGRVLDRLPEGRLAGERARGEITFMRVDPIEYDIEIPAGTLVAMAVDSALEDTLNPIYYETTEDGVLLAGETQVTIPVIALEAGEIANAPASASMSLASPIVGITSLRNDEAFEYGTDQESDDDLRHRYINTTYMPGRATSKMLDEHLRALTNVVEAKIFTMGLGNVAIVVDTEEAYDEQLDTITDTIEENLAAGATAYGIILASILPNVIHTTEIPGGMLYAIPKTYAYNDDIGIHYLDQDGASRSITLHIDSALPGQLVPFELPEDVWATKVTSIDDYGLISYDIVGGLGKVTDEGAYLYNLPITLTVDANVRLRLTESPETGLSDLVEASLTARLNSCKIAEILRYSQAEYSLWEDAAGREFIGIDDIDMLELISANGLISSNGQSIVPTALQRIRAGTIHITTI